jgi:hypothetical protein
LPEIQDNEMREALQRSGYLLEARVEDLLCRHGYLVDANIAYPDPIEGKPRELDARATAVDYLDDRNAIWTSLLVECSNNNQPVVLMTKPQQPCPLPEDSIACVGVPTTVSDEPIRRTLSLVEYHHGCQGEVATQFCSFQQKKSDRGTPGEWMAHHDEGLWGAIRKLGDALAHDTADFARCWKPPAGGGSEEPINLTFYNCVLVLQGKLLSVDARLLIPQPKEITRGVIQRSLAWHRRGLDHFIDVVTEPGLPEYLETLDRERRMIVARVRARMDEFVRAASEEGERMSRQRLREAAAVLRGRRQH